MRTLWVLIFSLSSLLAAQSAAPKVFPTDEEIRLVVIQSERALGEYKQAVELEASLPAAKKDGSSLDIDRQLVETFPRLLGALKASPSKFNGLAGLLLLTTLDDASRNAALCSNSGMGDIAQELLSSHDTTAVYRIIAISQKCVDASTQLYTVSESVNALFVKAMEAQEDLGEQALDALNKCAAAAKPMPKSGKQ
jgi:hypothetical protein